MKNHSLSKCCLLALLLGLGGAAAAQAQTTCKVNDPDIAVTYKGGCKDGLAEGKGEARGRDVYVGMFKAGNPHGKGTYTWLENGRQYEGDWVEGIRTGKGTFTWPESDRRNCSSQFCSRRYVGEWRNDKKTCGKMEFWGGDSYDGCYEADGSTFLGKTKFQLAEQSRTYERTNRCQHVYEGRVFRRKENNMVGLFGDLEYIVLGFSASRGQATVKDRHDGSVQEISCTSIPE